MMKKLIIASLLGIFAFGMSAQAGKMIVSIGTFKNKSNCQNSEFRSLLDRITNSIVNTRKFNIVDNARLKEAVIEQKKVDVGLSSEQNAVKGGKIKSAGYVLYGTVLMLGVDSQQSNLSGIVTAKFVATVELNIRFMDVETGELVASKTVKAVKYVTAQRSGPGINNNNKAHMAVQSAIQEAADMVTEKLMDLAFPTVILKVANDKVYINLTEERAKPDMLLHVFSVGETLTDPDTGEALGSSEELVGDLKVIRTFPKYAIAAPVPPLTAAKLAKGMIVRPVSAQELSKKAAETKQEETTRFRKRF